MIAGAPAAPSRRRPRTSSRRCGRPEKSRCRAARGAPTCSTPRSSAAPRRMASSSTTATAMARRIAAASSSRRRLRVAYDTQRQRPRADRGDRRGLRDQHLRSPAPARPICASAASIRPARSGRSAPRWRPPSCAGSNAQQFANALGIAASSAAGLFAFVAGGGDIKRLHAGHASREGMQAALLAEQGTEGPPNVIEGRDGFMQAFAFGRIDKARPIKLPPAAEYGITDCYIKPYACCRHIQPAVEATFQLLQRREDRVRGHQEGRGRDLQDRGRARPCAVGRFRQRATELSVSGGARGALSRHQVRAFRREDAEGPGVRRVRATSSPSRRRPRSTSFIRGCGRRASR